MGHLSRGSPSVSGSCEKQQLETILLKGVVGLAAPGLSFTHRHSLFELQGKNSQCQNLKNFNKLN